MSLFHLRPVCLGCEKCCWVYRSFFSANLSWVNFISHILQVYIYIYTFRYIYILKDPGKVLRHAFLMRRSQNPWVFNSRWFISKILKLKSLGPARVLSSSIWLWSPFPQRIHSLWNYTSNSWRVSWATHNLQTPRHDLYRYPIPKKLHGPPKNLRPQNVIYTTICPSKLIHFVGRSEQLKMLKAKGGIQGRLVLTSTLGNFSQYPAIWSIKVLSSRKALYMLL